MLVHILTDYLDECYLVLWEEENSVSVVPACNVAKGRREAIGEYCDVMFKRKSYPGRVAAKGMKYFMQVYFGILAGYLFVRVCYLG